MHQLCRIVFKINPDQYRPVFWSIVVTEKPKVASPYFGALPSDRNPTVTKDVTVHILTNSSNS
jgi:hypothetical protein